MLIISSTPSSNPVSKIYQDPARICAVYRTVWSEYAPYDLPILKLLCLP